ncbi:Short chain enoyl-CoA hydratase,related [Neospora caninum Liverpool]|uniref:Short chain enoyl-CoA hydratase, related n=1 Tax=Neospora caninum (strain Liverpool) TaxID=572307 RepID=F0VMW7_NEOCL|nr:Short chain enoyl-CoA hydratase,related [Neospora caninum Liverpool]CBZ55063.1 Short chain enoyl-CoA hydratase,related [Neospora caninum Liverpool]CEL69787.1 TPA: Short chain enoyl-CoA hydratase, related [Neospora caninum Liverpool]|eukprot:XP_003885091.1 Short chain enoyl-CoA hydratase,related [Neospora caninum Liverpool]
MEKRLASFRTLKVDRLAFSDGSPAGAPKLSFVYEVCLNRPQQRNAFDHEFWTELRECFDLLDRLSSCRCVIITAAGSVFTAGIDLAFAGQIISSPVLPRRTSASPVENPEQPSKARLAVDSPISGEDPDATDPDCARKAAHLRRYVTALQDCFSAVEECSKPVIACVGGPCVGAGVDLVCSCDIRVASEEAWFSVKEVDLGLAADVGTLQRLPRIVGNDAWAREICFTGRRVGAEEARREGLLSALFESREEMRQKAIALAREIAGKSPVAVAGIKFALNFSTRRTVREELRVQAIWNGAMLQTHDIPTAMAQAALGRGAQREAPANGEVFACL